MQSEMPLSGCAANVPALRAHAERTDSVALVENPQLTDDTQGDIYLLKTFLDFLKGQVASSCTLWHYRRQTRGFLIWQRGRRRKWRDFAVSDVDPWLAEARLPLNRAKGAHLRIGRFIQFLHEHGLCANGVPGVALMEEWLKTQIQSSSRTRHGKRIRLYLIWQRDQGRKMSEFAESHGDEMLQSLPHDLEHSGFRLSIALFLTFLRAKGITRTPPPALDLLPQGHPHKPRRPASLELADYLEFLAKDRGICASSIANAYYRLRRFTRSLPPGLQLSAITISHIHDWIRNECERGIRGGTLQGAAMELRRFLRYLRLRGILKNDVSNAVPTVAATYEVKPPYFLQPDDIAKLLQTFDLRTTQGRRDYAITLVVVRLGLRPCEICGLQLRDLDWKNSRLFVQAKGSEGWLTFDEEVGAAIGEYLSRDRGKATSTSVFLTLRLPQTGLHPSGLYYMVGRHYKAARLNPPRKGLYTLRHSCATHMLRSGVPLFEIGRRYRHKDPATTMQYAKVDFGALRQVARAWEN